MHEPAMYQEGEQGAGEFHRRQAVYQDKMSPLGKRSLGRKYFRLAQEAWSRGDRNVALKQVALSIQFDPLNRAAIDLRSDIWAGTHSGDHSGGSHLPPEPPAEIGDGTISPWILDELEHAHPLSSQAEPVTQQSKPKGTRVARPLRSTP
jgi:hypothetical protein